MSRFFHRCQNLQTFCPDVLLEEVRVLLQNLPAENEHWFKTCSSQRMTEVFLILSRQLQFLYSSETPRLHLSFNSHLNCWIHPRLAMMMALLLALFSLTTSSWKDLYLRIRDERNQVISKVSFVFRLKMFCFLFFVCACYNKFSHKSHYRYLFIKLSRLQVMLLALFMSPTTVHADFTRPLIHYTQM